MNQQALSRVLALPKAELHVHLEGTLTPEMAFDFACRHGHPLADDGLESIEFLYRHEDFHDFLDHLKILYSLLEYPGDIYELVLHYIELAQQSNIVYAEVLLTPVLLVSDEMPYPALMAILEKGAEQARAQGLELRFILDTVRQWGAECFEATLRFHEQDPCPWVVAIGIGGDETAVEPEEFAALFERARQAGLHTVVHSGEIGDAASVRKTLEALRPERILHGIRAVEDAALVEELAQRRIPLDVCPSSNVATGVVASLGVHPIRQLFDAGVRVTLNTDDPPMFQTCLNREYELIARNLGFYGEELYSIVQNGFRAAFLPEERKEAFLDRLTQAWNSSNF